MPCFCTYCGARNPDESRFCSGCGKQLATPQLEGHSDYGTSFSSSSSSSSNINIANTPRPEPAKIEEISPIVEELKRIYKTKVKPVEAAYRFEDFYSACLTDTDFDAKPMVLMLGQYSVGKTSFIRYMLERDFPGANIGPEPTTDRFMAVMYGKQERRIPGNALAVSADKPFTGLNKFGMNFLDKFEGSECDSPLLQQLTFIDTPGVLSGEKQRIDRSYNFAEIIAWFAERADRILLLFDAHKLDISDEFKTAIEALKGHDDKVRIVLNKADIETQQLMRVYGALMWSLGKVVKTPEVFRVYIGSFWDKPLNCKSMETLLKAEQEDLLADLRALPRNSTIRKVNEMVKRARRSKVHAYICHHLREQFGMFSKKEKQEKLLANLQQEFEKVKNQYGLASGDFPNVQRYKELLGRFELWKFPKIDKKQIASMDEVLATDIPRLMRQLPNYEESHKVSQASSAPSARPFDGEEKLNPFHTDAADRLAPSTGWAVSAVQKTKYDNEFYELKLNSDKKVSGADARPFMIRSGLPAQELKKIWDLADMDADGFLDVDEFAVCCWLMDSIKSGKFSSCPNALPDDLIPPSKRH